MNKVQLRQIIKEVVVRKLRELDMNKPGVTGDSKPDASKLTDAERKKLEDLNKKAADLTAKKQKLEGNIADLRSQIQSSVQGDERKLTKVTAALGKIRAEIQKIEAKA